MKRSPVAVLGGGAWGTLLAQLLTRHLSVVPLWVRDDVLRSHLLEHRENSRFLPGVTLSPAIQPSGNLEETVRSADILIFALPTYAFREVARRAGDVVEGDQILVSGAKGLEEGSGARMSEILGQETCARLIGAMGGPAYADELGRGQVGAVVIGSGFNSVVERVQATLASEQIRVYGNQDILGVEIGGALASVVVLVCGMVKGLEMGGGVTAVVLGRGLSEVTRLGVALGARASTFQGLSVLGDMTAAVLSGQGRDFRLGVALARGASLQEALGESGTPESVTSTRMALALAQKSGVEVPLVAAMGKVLFEGIRPQDLIRELMKRRSIYES